MKKIKAREEMIKESEILFLIKLKVLVRVLNP